MAPRQYSLTWTPERPSVLICTLAPLPLRCFRSPRFAPSAPLAPVCHVPYAAMNLDDLVAQQEIRDVLARYTRGIDRMDRDLVLSCYHAGAYDDHGAFQGTAEDFTEWVQQVLSYFDTTMHFLG